MVSSEADICSTKEEPIEYETYCSYFNEYPVDIATVEPLRFDELDATQIDADLPISYDQATYAYSGDETYYLKRFARTFSVFTRVWERQRLMYLGLNKDITQARIFAIYVDPEDECNYVVTTYPGQAIEFSEEHYDENNCLNIHSWFGTVWDK